MTIIASKPDLDPILRELREMKGNPFPGIHPPDYVPFMIGGKSLIEEFKRIYENCSRGMGPFGIFLVGAPGYGKTHFLKHLSYLFYKKHDMKGIYFRYEAYGGVNIYNPDYNNPYYNKYYNPNYSDLLSKMFSDDNVKNLTVDTVNNRVDEQLRLLRSICRKLYDRDSICIAIDNIDEYIRGKGEEDIAGFIYDTLLRHLRDIMEQGNNIIIILALTHDAYSKVRRSLSDPTYSRRFSMTIYVDGFDSVSQIQNMFKEYIKLWCGNKPWCENLLRAFINGEHIFSTIFEVIQQEPNLKGKSPAAFCILFNELFEIFKAFIYSRNKLPVRNELLAILYVTLKKIKKGKDSIVKELPARIDDDKLYEYFKKSGNIGVITNIYGALPRDISLENLAEHINVFAKYMGATISDESSISHRFYKWKF
ncbi:MAG: AAA family ATPase, partial [Candidatus Methanomethylicia archaeon]